MMVSRAHIRHPGDPVVLDPRLLFYAPLQSHLVDLVSGAGAIFTRTDSTNPTYTDLAGNLRLAGLGQPRFEAAGLLMEPGATNIIQYPSKLDSWAGTDYDAVKVGVTSGGLDVWRCTRQSGRTEDWRRKIPGTSSGAVAGTTYTITALVTASSTDKISLAIYGDAGVINGSSRAILSTLTQDGVSLFTGGAHISASISKQNDLYVYKWTFSISANSTAWNFGIGNNDTTDVNSWIDIVGCTIEATAFSTSPVLGASQSVARASEVGVASPANGLRWDFNKLHPELKTLFTGGKSGTISVRIKVDAKPLLDGENIFSWRNNAYTAYFDTSTDGGGDFIQGGPYFSNGVLSGNTSLEAGATYRITATWSPSGSWWYVNKNGVFTAMPRTALKFGPSDPGNYLWLAFGNKLSPRHMSDFRVYSTELTAAYAAALGL